jgi:hypothetical protein
VAQTIVCHAFFTSDFVAGEFTSKLFERNLSKPYVSAGTSKRLREI